MRTFIERLDRERTDALAIIDGTLERAGTEDRDLTDTEEAVTAEAKTRLEKIDLQRSEWTTLAERRATGDQLAGRIETALSRAGTVAPIGATPARDDATTLWRSAGEYVRDVVLRKTSPDSEARLQRAIANQVLADNVGVVPQPILGPVVNTLNSSRPFWNSATQRPMPGGGQVFTRPIITQHASVGVQSAEKTEIASQKLLLGKTNVTKATYGGALDISFQDRDWTDPAILQIVIDDLAGVYGQQTDNAAVDAFVTAVVQTTPITPPVTGVNLTASIAAAAGLVYTATNRMPDTMWASPDVWGLIAGLTDTTGRALFASIGATNSSGSVSPSSFAGNLYGLTLVVDANMAAKTAIVGNSGYTEVYEQVGGQLSVTEPTILGFTVAYYGYIAYCTVIPSAFVKISGIIP